MKRIILACALLLAALIWAPQRVAAAAPVNGNLAGTAFGGLIRITGGSTTTTEGPFFPVSQPSGSTLGTRSASGASMMLGQFGSSGTVLDTVTTSRSSSLASVSAASTVQDVRLLGGLVTAGAITARANSSGTATTASASSGATFTGLTVSGVHLTATPAPNTRVTLPGVGYVILNERYGTFGGTQVSNSYVYAMDVHVTTANLLGLPVGSQIIVAYAGSSFARTAFPGCVGASAYGLYSTAGAGNSAITSGPWAPAFIGCGGGRSTVAVARTSMPAGTTGVVEDVAVGTLAASGASAQASSTVDTTRLFGGLVTANAASSHAQIAFNGTGTASGTTTVTNGRIAGIAISAQPAPNSRITIPGIGYAILNEQFGSKSSTAVAFQVDAIDVYVTTANAFGVPVGAHVVVAQSVATYEH